NSTVAKEPAWSANLPAIKPMFSGEVASGFPLRLAAIFPFSYAAETSSSESEGSFLSNSLPRSVSMIFALLGWLVPTRIAKRERGVMRKAHLLAMVLQNRLTMVLRHLLIIDHCANRR